MGTKGKDLLFWLADIIAILLIIAVQGKELNGVVLKVGCWIFVVLLLALFKFNIIDRTLAFRKSKKAGLEVLTLIPLNKYWARAILSFSGIRLTGKWDRAYEIHIDPKIKDPKTIAKGIINDVLLIARNMSGLFVWETKIAIPRKIKKLIEMKERRNEGFWREGGWFPPPPPFCSKPLKKGKKTVRRGAILHNIEGGIQT